MHQVNDTLRPSPPPRDEIQVAMSDAKVSQDLFLVLLRRTSGLEGHRHS